MKLISANLISFCFLIILSNTAHADWWDCEVGLRTPGWKDDGTYNYTWKGDVEVEVEADRRSDAERKAGRGRYVTKRGFFGSKSVYACSLGNKTENGDQCEWHLGNASCRRQ